MDEHGTDRVCAADWMRLGTGLELAGQRSLAARGPVSERTRQLKSGTGRMQKVTARLLRDRCYCVFEGDMRTDRADRQ